MDWAFFVLFLMLKLKFFAVHVSLWPAGRSPWWDSTWPGTRWMLTLGRVMATRAPAAVACMPAVDAEAGATNPAMVMHAEGADRRARASWFLIETNSVSFVVRLPVRPGRDGQRATAMRAHPAVRGSPRLTG